MPTFDDLVKKLPPGQQAIFSILRKVMKDTAPSANEWVAYGIPVWRMRRIIAVANPAKTHVTFAFAKGARFEDKFGMLEGSGNVSRHIKIKDAKDIDNARLRYYIRQARKIELGR